MFSINLRHYSSFQTMLASTCLGKNFLYFTDLEQSGLVNKKWLQENKTTAAFQRVPVYVYTLNCVNIIIDIYGKGKVLHAKKYFNRYEPGTIFEMMQCDYQIMLIVLKNNKQHYHVRMIQAAVRGMLTRRKVHFALMNIHVDPDALERLLGCGSKNSSEVKPKVWITKTA